MKILHFGKFYNSPCAIYARMCSVHKAHRKKIKAILLYNKKPQLMIKSITQSI